MPDTPIVASSQPVVPTELWVPGRQAAQCPILGDWSGPYDRTSRVPLSGSDSCEPVRSSQPDSKFLCKPQMPQIGNLGLIATRARPPELFPFRTGIAQARLDSLLDP